MYGTFEQGPADAGFCCRAVTEAARAGARGTVMCSNTAPLHPLWQDSRLRQENAAP